MSMKHYAEINQSNICIAELETTTPINSPTMIEVVGVMGSFMGKLYENGQFVEPPEPPAPPEQRYIFVGSFFDRFGAHKWPILADSNPMVQALVKDCQVRRYIDLDNPELPSGLGMLVQVGHAIDPNAVINAPITESERWVG